jgi:heme/copper-type cytochrome/quinol oxidase subunit 1
MTTTTTTFARQAKVSYVRLVAPLLLIAFAVLWYEFSVVYIQGANNQLLAYNNLAVYVTLQQVSAYLQVLLITTYVTAAAGALAFAYYLVKLLRIRARSQARRSAVAIGASQREASSPPVR